MDMLITLLTHWRRMMLSRQAVAVRQAVLALNAEQRKAAADHTLAEIQHAATLPQPHLHGVTESSIYRPWSQVASTAAGPRRPPPAPPHAARQPARGVGG
ncbi:MAG: hypothetical protein K0M70_06960, partial [Arenimonas sp.]|nr:hypothetical protein [Arenimonas sp.]